MNNVLDSSIPNFMDTISVFIVAGLTTGISEGISWFLIYRTKDFQELHKKFKSLTSKIDKQKEELSTNTKSKKFESKISENEKQLQEVQGQIAREKLKSTMVVALFMIIFISSLYSSFQDIVVGKLPFVPFSILTGFTHRGLSGNNYSECSMLFLYVLSNIVLRSVVEKIMGYGGGNKGFAPNFFGNIK